MRSLTHVMHSRDACYPCTSAYCVHDVCVCVFRANTQNTDKQNTIYTSELEVRNIFFNNSFHMRIMGIDEGRSTLKKFSCLWCTPYTFWNLLCFVCAFYHRWLSSCHFVWHMFVPLYLFRLSCFTWAFCCCTALTVVSPSTMFLSLWYDWTVCVRVVAVAPRTWWFFRSIDKIKSHRRMSCITRWYIFYQEMVWSPYVFCVRVRALMSATNTNLFLYELWLVHISHASVYTFD